MSRKSIILCLSLLAVMLVGLGVAIAVLYSGTETSDRTGNSSVAEGSRSCLCVVPSDAVLVSCYSRMDRACNGILSAFRLPSALAESIEDGVIESLRKAQMAVSLHYAGKLYPLYVVDVSKASDGALDGLEAVAVACGMCSARVGDYVVVSESETLVRASERHYAKNVSISNAAGFSSAVSSVGAEDVLLMSNLHSERLLRAFFTRKLSSRSAFVERVSDWMAFNTGSSDQCPLSLDGVLLFDGDADEFMTVFEECTPAETELSHVLPSYTLSAVSLPMKDMQTYISAYKSFVDSRQGLPAYLARQKELGSKAGVMPEDLLARLEVKEMASASFIAGGGVEKVNMLRVGSKDASLILKDAGVSSFKGYVPAVHAWAYPSFIASVFGKQFSLPDESCCTYLDGWIVTGSSLAVGEFVAESSSEYSLADYMADAGQEDMLAAKPALVVGYVSMTEALKKSSDFFTKDMSELLAGVTAECDYSPLVMHLTRQKKEMYMSLDLFRNNLRKTKAPSSHKRDTVVVVPQGPFNVRNSATGKINTFYQNSNDAVCLRDENGKDLWGVPLGKKLCGTAHNVDYYANGKLQIIFGAGSSVYVIDRLGRYVTGFPLDLGREILIGPDVYDFSGARRYNIVVLHKDNTIQMYNLKGKKPEAWKDITSDEKIKSLPERLTVGGKDFWVVRTAVQTLIFPFYGGAPLTVFEGDAMIRPDSEIKILDNASVQAVSYDGKARTVALK